MNSQRIKEKRHFISNKIIIGIDPSKRNHQAMVINEPGIPYCKSFSFNNSFKGFHEELWIKLQRNHYTDFSRSFFNLSPEFNIGIYYQYVKELIE